MSSTLEVRLEALVAGAFEACPDSPSVAVAVVCDRHGLDWQRGASRGHPLSPQGAAVPFRIASITKPFVAAAIHQLAADGRLSTSQPIADLLHVDTAGVLARGGHDPQAIRVWHLLTHTSGLPDHTLTSSYQAAARSTPRRRWTRLEQVALASLEGERLGLPGEVYSYSDTGYILLGEIIERATSEPLATAVRNRLDFAHLGLSSTWWEHVEAAPTGQLPPARVRFETIDGMSVDASFDLFGGGGLISTVGDLNRFFQALIEGDILPADQLAGALATPLARLGPNMPDWRTHSHLLASMRAGPHWALGHTGFWGSAAVRLPALGLSVALTLNAGGPAASAAVRGLLDEIVTELDDGHRP